MEKTTEAFLDEYAWRGCGYTGWQVAYALDHHNSKVEEAVRRILTEENGSGMMTNELVRGVLFSHRADFHELLGKLLLAARLQEGLRQVICENADYGTKAGFLTILKVIADNNLIRFSSVKRAVGTWLGILTEESRDLERVSEKSVRLIIDCLENEDVRKECLASEDAMKIYIALWSYGLDDIDDAVQKIVDIADNGSIHQLLVAGYFAANLDLPYISNQIANARSKLAIVLLQQKLYYIFTDIRTLEAQIILNRAIFISRQRYLCNNIVSCFAGIGFSIHKTFKDCFSLNWSLGVAEYFPESKLPELIRGKKTVWFTARSK